MQLTSYYLLSTLNILDIDEDVILEQYYDNKLNSNNIVKLISSLRRSTLLLIVSISSILAIKSAQIYLVTYISSSSIV